MPAKSLSLDLIAGISIAGLLLPEAVAYSGIAGLSPQSGLIALLLGLVVYGLIGTSRFAIVSSTSSAAAVLSSAMAAYVSIHSPERASLAAALVLLTGVFLILAGLFKLGEITQFIAKPVLKGFSFGLALSIVAKQLPLLVQVHPLHSDFFRQLADIIRHYSEWNMAALAMGVITFLLLWQTQSFKKVPAALLLIIAGITLNLAGFTGYWNIHAVGAFDLSLPTLSLPMLSLGQWLNLSGVAIAMVMIIYAESYTSIRTFALKYNDTSNANRDLMALGVANLLSGTLRGMPVGAGYSATSANEAAGAQSKKSAWYAATMVGLLLLFFRDYIAYIPEPVLAAIVIHAVSGHIRLEPFRQYFIWHDDRIISMSAIAAVLLFGILNGLLIAIGISIIMMLRNYSKPLISWLGQLNHGHDYVDTSHYQQAIQPKGIIIARPDEPIFFANAEHILGLVLKKALDESTQGIILSLEESPSLDSSSIEALLAFAQHLHEHAIQLQLARVKQPVTTTLSKVNSPLLPEPSYASQSVDDAVTTLQTQLCCKQ